MKKVFNLLVLCFFLSSYAQTISPSQLQKNDWVNKNLNFLKFYKDSVTYNLAGKKHTLYYELAGKLLTFKEKFAVGGTDLREEKISMKIASLSKDKLVLTSVEDVLSFDQEIFYKLDYAPFFSRDKFVFSNRENQVDYIDYKKITFHASTCFGTCPSFSLEINRGGELHYQGRIYAKEYTGDFEGFLEREERIVLHKIINRSLLPAIDATWQQRSRPTDTPRYTYIIELRNGDKMEINTNDQHPLLDNLSSYLLDITNKLKLTKSKEKHRFDRPSLYGFEIVAGTSDDD